MANAMRRALHKAIVDQEFRGKSANEAFDNSETDESQVASKPTRATSSAPAARSLLFDFTFQDVRALSTFEQQWLLAHVLSGTSLACIYLTGSGLLWIAPCVSGARQSIMGLTRASQDAVTSWSAAILTALAVFFSKGDFLDFGPAQKLPRYVLGVSQVLFLTGGWVLGTAVYSNTGPWHALNILRAQTGLAS